MLSRIKTEAFLITLTADESAQTRIMVVYPTIQDTTKHMDNVYIGIVIKHVRNL